MHREKGLYTCHICGYRASLSTKCSQCHENLYLIHSVKDGSLSEENGIYRGLLIISVNGVYPKSLEELFQTLKSNKKVDIIFKGWSSSDNVLYDYQKISYFPENITFY